MQDKLASTAKLHRTGISETRCCFHDQNRELHTFIFSVLYSTQSFDELKLSDSVVTGEENGSSFWLGIENEGKIGWLFALR